MTNIGYAGHWSSGHACIAVDGDKCILDVTDFQYGSKSESRIECSRETLQLIAQAILSAMAVREDSNNRSPRP